MEQLSERSGILGILDHKVVIEMRMMGSVLLKRNARLGLFLSFFFIYFIILSTLVCLPSRDD